MLATTWHISHFEDPSLMSNRSPFWALPSTENPPTSTQIRPSGPSKTPNVQAPEDNSRPGENVQCRGLWKVKELHRNHDDVLGVSLHTGV